MRSQNASSYCRVSFSDSASCIQRSSLPGPLTFSIKWCILKRGYAERILSMTRGWPSSYAMLSCQVGSDTDMPCTECAGIDSPSAVGIRAFVTVAGIDRVKRVQSLKDVRSPMAPFTRNRLRNTPPTPTSNHGDLMRLTSRGFSTTRYHGRMRGAEDNER